MSSKAITRLWVRKSNNAAFVFGYPLECGQIQNRPIASGGMHPASAAGIGVNFGLEPACIVIAGAQYRMRRAERCRAILAEMRFVGFGIGRHVSEQPLV